MQGNQIEYAKCNCIEFVPDGKSVISGWTDGRIRAFLPQSGKLFWVINDAHKAVNKDFGGVMCMTTAQNCEHILTGGQDGEVKLWCVGKQSRKLQSSQKIHKGQITALQMVGSNDQMVASSSMDGTIIIWRLQKLQSLQKMHYV